MIGDGKRLILCPPATEELLAMAKRYPVDMVTVECCGCKAKLIAAPSSVKMVEADYARPVCPDCAMKDTAKRVPAVAAEALDELRAINRADAERN